MAGTSGDDQPDDDDSASLSPSLMARHEDRRSLRLWGRTDSFELEAVSHSIVVRTNQLPVAERKAKRQAYRNVASRLKQESSNNAGNASVANGLGFLGGSLLVGAVLVSGPLTLPLIVIGVSGALSLIGGLATGAILGRNANNQMHQANLIENIVSEIEL